MLYVTIAIIELQMIVYLIFCNKEGLSANDAQTGSKLVHTTISVARELTKDQPLLLGSENNVKNLSKIR